MEEKLNTILAEVAHNIGGTIGISIVELESGMALATYSTQKEFNLDVAAAYNAEVVKQKMKAMTALNLKNQTISEFIIVLTTQTHLINIVNPKYILYFAYDSTVSNLAMAKAVLASASDKLKSILV